MKNVGCKQIFVFIFIIQVLSVIALDNKEKDGLLVFYFMQGIDSYVMGDINNNLSIINELGVNLSYKKDFYILTGHFSDIFVFDLYNVLNNSIADFDMKELIYNYFIVGLEHSFKYMAYIEMKINTDVLFESSFADGLYIQANTDIKFAGNYYYGFFWNADAGFLLNVDPIYNNISYDIEMCHYTGYEFFRFYGPDNFKFGMSHEINSTISFYNNEFNNFITTLDNSIYFKLFDLITITTGFTNKLSYSEQVLYKEIGVKNGFDINFKFFNFIVDHLFLSNVDTGVFYNNISVSVKFLFHRRL